MFSFIAGLLNQLAATCQPSVSFFGLTPWYGYLDGETDAFGRCVPVLNSYSDLWKIGLAVVDDLLKIVALLAVGFVIYGGIQYIVSSGEPDKTKRAKDTILNALIGMVIAIVATGFVTYLGGKLKAGTGDTPPTVSADSSQITMILQIVFVAIGVISVIVIALAGLNYVLSNGDPQKTAKAKDTILYAVIGLVISIMATTIVTFVLGRL